jgi:hypothetical protein
MKLLPKLYSNAWLKELRQALMDPNFHTAPSKEPLQNKHYYTINNSNYGGKKAKNLTDQEYTNLQIARSLIETR